MVTRAYDSAGREATDRGGVTLLLTLVSMHTTRQDRYTAARQLPEYKLASLRRRRQAPNRVAELRHTADAEGDNTLHKGDSSGGGGRRQQQAALCCNSSALFVRGPPQPTSPCVECRCSTRAPPQARSPLPSTLALIRGSSRCRA
jgi:hypothetical protein